MSSKGSYDPVGKSNPQTGLDPESGDDNSGKKKSSNSRGVGGKGKSSSSNSAGGTAGTGAEGESGGGFVVRVRKMERRNWLILAGAGLLVALVVIVAVVLVTTQTEDAGVAVNRSKSESSNGKADGSSALLSRSGEALKGERPAFCLEEPDPGMCRAYFEMYHYDAKSDSCKMFVYGGCDGNANRFRSLAQCERDCLAGNRGSNDVLGDEVGGDEDPIPDEEQLAQDNDPDVKGGSQNHHHHNEKAKVEQEVPASSSALESANKGVKIEDAKSR